MKSLEAGAMLAMMRHEEETPVRAAIEEPDEVGHDTIYLQTQEVDGQFDTDGDSTMAGYAFYSIFELTHTLYTRRYWHSPGPLDIAWRSLVILHAFAFFSPARGSHVSRRFVGAVLLERVTF